MISQKFDCRAYPEGCVFTQFTLDDGWPLRVFSWPAGDISRGTILFVGGRGDFLEKYLESFADWHVAGWGVVAIDWRGQGGSGRITKNARVGHIDDFAIWMDDLSQFWQAFAAVQPGPHIIIGHSMGGHLILRALEDRRITPAAAILIAPMLGIETPPLPLPVAKILFGALVKIGLGERPAWKGNERPAAPWASRQRFLTSDNKRYADEIWWLKNKPEIALGPPSFGWLSAAITSTQASEGQGLLERVTLPLLILGTDGDRLVSTAAIRRCAARLSGVMLYMYNKTVGHEILRERDDVRGDALMRIDSFLARAAPLR